MKNINQTEQKPKQLTNEELDITENEFYLLKGVITVLIQATSEELDEISSTKVKLDEQIYTLINKYLGREE